MATSRGRKRQEKPGKKKDGQGYTGVFRVSTGEAQIRIRNDAPDPERRFFADWVLKKTQPGGTTLTFLQFCETTGDLVETVTVVMSDAAYTAFIDTFQGVRETFLTDETGCPYDLPDLKEPKRTSKFLGMVSRAATTFSGVSIQFYSASAWDIWQVGQGAISKADLKAVVGIDMLPGRLAHLLRD